MWFFLRLHVLYLFKGMSYLYTAQVRPWASSQTKPYGGECAMQSNWNPKDEFY